MAATLTHKDKGNPVKTSESSGLRLNEGNQLGVEDLVRQNEQLRKEVRDLLSIGEVARSITSTLLIEEVLAEILRGIRQTLAFDRVLLGLVNAEARYEEIKLAIGTPASLIKKARWSISESDPIWKRLQQERRPVIVDPPQEVEVPEFISAVFPDAFIKAPLVVKGEIIGSIMAAGSPRAATARDIHLLQILVEYAAIAVENGRLYYDVIRSDEELKKTQEQLVEAERLAAVGQFAVSLNHEINNPLCTIKMSAQLLKLELEERAPALIERLESIEQAVLRINEVTQRVSKMSKLRSTEYLPNQMMIDLK